MISNHELGRAEQIASDLRRRAISGKLLPGQRLSEAQLAAELNISRNTLREVFRLLIREGLLNHEPHRGVFVAMPSMATIVDIFRVRRLIEVPAIAQAWPRHTAVAGMRSAVEAAEACAEEGAWASVGSANMEFHGAIVALTDSPRLMTFFSQLAAELRLAFCMVPCQEELHSPFLKQNRLILELVVSGDNEKAAAALNGYLDQSERRLLEMFAIDKARRDAA